MGGGLGGPQRGIGPEIVPLFTNKRLYLSQSLSFLMPLPPDVGMVLNQYFKSHGKIKLQCLLTNKEFHKTVEKYTCAGDYVITPTNPVLFGAYTYAGYAVTDSSTNEPLGEFQSLQTVDALYVFSGSSANFFKCIVLQLLKKLYPQVLLASIHSSDIYNILSNYEKKHNVLLNYNRVVRKVIFGKNPRTQLDWESAKEGRVYSSFKAAFQKSEEANMWVDSIQVFSSKQTNKEFFNISRKGLVSFHSGRFDVFFSDILNHIVEHSKNRNEKFKNRSRSVQPDKRPKPLIVKFGKNIFEKLETRQEFSKILAQYPNCSYSVIHSGNPHVYLSVLDRNDNSSFAVRTYGDDSLLLIPQIETSSLSLMRFSEFLVSKFYEGIIENFE